MALASFNLAASSLSALAAKLAPTQPQRAHSGEARRHPGGRRPGGWNRRRRELRDQPRVRRQPRRHRSCGSIGARRHAGRSAPSPQRRLRDRPCEAQTWPYIDSKLHGRRSAAEAQCASSRRRAPSEAPDAAPRPQRRGRGMRHAATRCCAAPQNIDAIPPPKPSRRRATKRTRAAPQARPSALAAQSYQVPGELRPTRSRPVIVVRPLRLDAASARLRRARTARAGLRDRSGSATRRQARA